MPQVQRPAAVLEVLESSGDPAASEEELKLFRRLALRLRGQRHPKCHPRLRRQVH